MTPFHAVLRCAFPDDDVFSLEVALQTPILRLSREPMPKDVRIGEGPSADRAPSPLIRPLCPGLTPPTARGAAPVEQSISDRGATPARQQPYLLQNVGRDVTTGGQRRNADRETLTKGHTGEHELARAIGVEHWSGNTTTRRRAITQFAVLVRSPAVGATREIYCARRLSPAAHLSESNPATHGHRSIGIRCCPISKCPISVIAPAIRGCGRCDATREGICRAQRGKGKQGASLGCRDSNRPEARIGRTVTQLAVGVISPALRGSCGRNSASTAATRRYRAELKWST